MNLKIVDLSPNTIIPIIPANNIAVSLNAAT